MIEITPFGYTAQGGEVLAFTMTDGESYARFLNYGGTLQALVVPDRDGHPTDVVLGYHDVASYETKGGHLGGLIGRFGNRIANAELTIDETTYHLAKNNHGNHLHGGPGGFDRHIWQHEIDGDALTFTYFSPDGEENYPGNLTVRVTYTFREGTLTIQYHAVSDAKTAINLTNHAYFNLNGEGRGDVLGHTLWLNSARITPIDENVLPTGDFRAVESTPFDFKTAPKPIGRDIHADDVDIRNGQGYDHCFILDHPKGVCSTYAVAQGNATGITMTCYTDAPGVQLYTGNHLKQDGKSAYYGANAGFCLETQAIPNNVNVPDYAALGSSIIDAGVPYTHTSVYAFGTEAE